MEEIKMKLWYSTASKKKALTIKIPQNRFYLQHEFWSNWWWRRRLIGRSLIRKIFSSLINREERGKSFKVTTKISSKKFIIGYKIFIIKWTTRKYNKKVHTQYSIKDSPKCSLDIQGIILQFSLSRNDEEREVYDMTSMYKYFKICLDL